MRHTQKYLVVNGMPEVFFAVDIYVGQLRISIKIPRRRPLYSEPLFMRSYSTYAALALTS